jgi:hypothetical protein
MNDGWPSSLRAGTAAVLLVLCLGEAHAARKLLLGVWLQWRPTDNKPIASVDRTGLAEASIAFGPYTDNRQKPDLIGESREEEDEGKVLPVTTASEVPEFCRVHMQDMFKQAGAHVPPSGAVFVLKGQVEDFFVTERDRYVGSVRIKLDLAKGGKSVWSGYAVGASKRWGRSYKVDNYYQASSDALMDATAKLLNEPSFRDALGGRRR